jgi:beta-lactamase class A
MLRAILVFGLCAVALEARTLQDDVTPRESLLETIEGQIRGVKADSVAVAFLDSSRTEDVLLRPDESVHAASTMKLPVMMEIYRQAEAKRLRLDEKLTIRNDFPSLADGSPFALDPADDSELTLYKRLGEQESIRELNRLMITESSNLATNLLIERVSAKRVAATMEELGARDIRVLRGVEDGVAFRRGMNNTVTARGLAHLLKLLVDGKADSPRASDEMLTVLKGQKFHEGIPAGLPKGTPVAHKTGWIEGRFYHDAAVVYPPGRPPFVLVVLTRGIADDAKAYRLVADISRVVYARVISR